MKRSHHIIKLLHGQRGGVAIWFALLLPVLLGVAALAVDLAHINMAKTELQNAADAAALAGARLLTDPSGEQPYSWTIAENTAKSVAKQNYANGSLVQDANLSVDSGYWNIPGSSYSPSHTSTVTGDVPAVRATVSIPGLKLFFAPIWGIVARDVHASAIAVIAPPGGGPVFPFAITQSIFNPSWWDFDQNKPKINPLTGAPYSIKVSLDSVYPSGGKGNWTSLTYPIGQGSSKDPIIGDIINAGDNTAPVSIGQSIWIATGTMDNLYKNKQYTLPIGDDVAVPVVQNVIPGSWQTIVAIAGFHIDAVGGNGNKSFFTGHFIDAATISSLNPGNGNGLPYGAYTPPLLVK